MTVYTKKPIYVIDLETTGLEGYPYDVIVEVGVYRISRTLKVRHIYNTLIGHPVSKQELIDNSWWSKQSGVKFEDMHDSPSMEIVWRKLYSYIGDYPVVSWNTPYDFGMFLNRMSIDYTLKQIWKELPDPMRISAPIVRANWNNYYQSWKWPTLKEASEYYDVYLDPAGYDFHRADYDTHITALTIAEMIRRGDYRPKEVIA